MTCVPTRTRSRPPAPSLSSSSLGRRYSELPRALVKACEGHRLPLISLHRELRFVKVTQAVHSLIVEEQISALHASESAHRVFTRLCVEGCVGILDRSRGGSALRTARSCSRTSSTRSSPTRPRHGRPMRCCATGVRGRGPRRRPSTVTSAALRGGSWRWSRRAERCGGGSCCCPTVSRAPLQLMVLETGSDCAHPQPAAGAAAGPDGAAGASHDAGRHHRPAVRVVGRHPCAYGGARRPHRTS